MNGVSADNGDARRPAVATNDELSIGLSSSESIEKLSSNSCIEHTGLGTENMSKIEMMSSLPACGSSSSSGKDNMGNNHNRQSIDQMSNGENVSRSCGKIDPATTQFLQAAALQMQQQHLINSSYFKQHQQYMSHQPMFMPRLYRKGKWTQEEEDFTKALISAFNEGYLAIPIGTTLRSFLSEKLNCDPMRITKKFSGDHSIGKQMYQPARDAEQEVLLRVQTELKELEEKFIAIVEPKSKHPMPPELLATPHMYNQFLHAHTMGVNPAGSSTSLQLPNVPAPVYPPAANLYRHQTAMSAGSLRGMVPPTIGSVLNSGGSSNEDNDNGHINHTTIANNTNVYNNPVSMLLSEQPMSSVNDQMASLSSSVPPLDMNVYFAQYQMEALAQAKAYALAQAHAYESYAVEQAQKNDFSDTYKQKKGNSIYPSNDSDSSGGKEKSSSEEKMREERIEEAEKKEAKDSELLLNFFEASKNSGLVPPGLSHVYNFSGLPALSQKTINRANSQSADVTSKEDSSHDSNNSNNNGSDASNERESDVSESSSDLDNNAPNSSVSDSNSNDTPPPEEKRDERDPDSTNDKKRYLSTKDGKSNGHNVDGKNADMNKRQKVVIGSE